MPRFCYRADPETTDWKPLDWYSHLLPGVNDRDFDTASVDEWRLGDELKKARNRYTLLNIEQLTMDSLALLGLPVSDRP